MRERKRNRKGMRQAPSLPYVSPGKRRPSRQPQRLSPLPSASARSSSSSASGSRCRPRASRPSPRVHLDLHLVAVDRDVLRDHREDLLAQHARRGPSSPRDGALVREQHLQPVAGDRRRRRAWKKLNRFMPPSAEQIAEEALPLRRDRHRRRVSPREPPRRVDVGAGRRARADWRA